MHPFFQPNVLTAAEISRIHHAMLRILSQTGMRIEHAGLREILASQGAEATSSDDVVRFPAEAIEPFLETSEPAESPSRGQLWCNAGVYQGWHLAPESGQYDAFTERTLAEYIKLARFIEQVDGIHLQNAPSAAGRVTEPLEVRRIAWKYGAQEDGGIQVTALCPYILEMYEIKADAEAKSLPDVFHAGVFMVSPLRLAASEAEQLMFFHNRGLRVWIANMITAGGTGPVTLAGCVALNLAENVAMGFISRALYGDRTWSLGSMVAPLDMRTMIQPYGRPEMLLTDLAAMQLARHYRVPCFVHTGLTDAKAPSVEAGAQKLLTALPCALAGTANIEPGLLSIDEVFSPIQMILDAEVAGAVRRALRGFEVDEGTLAVDLIDRARDSGMFAAESHTVEHFRQELWEPAVWAREMLPNWSVSGRKTDAAKALDVWRQILSLPDPDPGISEDVEKRLGQVIERAEARLKA